MDCSEERHVVAERLNAAANKSMFASGDFVEALSAEINLYGHDEWGDIFTRLADLIDPRCTVSESIDESDRGREFQAAIYTCTACGASWTNFDDCGSGGWAVTRGGKFVNVRYCPYCGSRVVLKGER